MPPESKTKQAILGGNNLSSQTGDYSITESKSGYQFLSGIIADIITDPIDYKEILKEIPDTDLKDTFKNWYAKDFLPLNTVVAYITDFANSQNESLRYFCFPFFSPHMSLPVKAGEYVWILRENFENTENYYWLSRKHGIRQVDELNYTNIERADLVVDVFNQIKKKKISKTQANKTSYTKSLSVNTFQPGLEYQTNLPSGINFDDIVRSSVTYSSEFTQEPVPLLKKECGDTLIQGSNNSFIQLTTEKFKLGDETVNNAFSETPDQFSKRKSLSPAIDIGVYRKKEQIEALKLLSGDARSGENFNTVVSNRINKDIKYHEIDKISEIFDDKKTYDTDQTPLNCGARIYMSNNCAIDEIFDITIEELEQLKGPSLVGYSDHVRLITNNSLRLINKAANSFIDMNSEGDVTVSSPTGGAKIILKSNGNIIIQPGDNGKLFLGGDEGTTMHTPLLQLAASTGPGSQEAAPLVSTLGGSLGLNDTLTGKFANKVLIK